MCQKSLFGHIRLHCKKLIANRTNHIVMPLRHFVIRRHLDKSDRIGIEPCYVPYNFGTTVSIALYWIIAPKFSCQSFLCAKLKQLFRKYSMMTQRRIETHSTSLCQYDLICPDGDVWHNGEVALRYDLSYWQLAVCNAIWYVQMATFGTSAQ